jgi:hypothetical protein
MLIPRLPLLAVAAFALFLGAVGVACTYNWTVDSAPVSSSSDSGTADATVDAGQDGGVVADAEPTDAATDVARPGPDAGDADSGSECAALLATLASARGTAKLCTFTTGQCTALISNECGCASYMGGSASSSSTTSYASSIARYQDAGCPRPSSCPLSCISPVGGTCVDSDGGATASCFP